MGGDPNRSSRQSSWWVLRRDWVLIICQSERSKKHCSFDAQIAHLELFPAVLNHVLGGAEIEPRIKFVDDSACATGHTNAQHTGWAERGAFSQTWRFKLRCSGRTVSLHSKQTDRDGRVHRIEYDCKAKCIEGKRHLRSDAIHTRDCAGGAWRVQRLAAQWQPGSHTVRRRRRVACAEASVVAFVIKVHDCGPR